MPKATLLVSSKQILPDGSLIEIVIWHVPTPVPLCEHHFKYSLVLIRDRKRLVGFDNERGKGDHMHLVGREVGFTFRDIPTLLRDFRIAVTATSRANWDV